MASLEGILDLWSYELAGFRAALHGHFLVVAQCVVVFSFAISIVWTLSGLFNWLRWRLGRDVGAIDADLPAYTVLIPFHGEAAAALRTAWSIASVTPAPAAILLVDDGSEETLAASAELPPGARVLHMPQRCGKAGALQRALESVETDVIVCLDADTVAQSHDWSGLLRRFMDAEVGAVTGKIWGVSNRNLIGRMQEIDYIAVITLIKAAEQLWGGLLTVSGAFVAFRRSALLSVKGWSSEKAAEDIDISWRLQLAGWRVEFDQSWVAAVEMAPTLPALWRQRRRWSAGLGQALYDHAGRLLSSGARHVPSVLVTLANALWIVVMLVFAFVAAGLFVMDLPSGTASTIAGLDLLRFAMFGLGLFFSQFLVASLIDGRSWRTYAGLLPYLLVYPFYFWAVLGTSFLAGFTRGVLHRDLGIWQPTIRAAEPRGGTP